MIPVPMANNTDIQSKIDAIYAEYQAKLTPLHAEYDSVIVSMKADISTDLAFLHSAHSGDTAPVTPQLRPLTTKERSYIQTFPRGHELVGSKADLEQMIGNAVPVKLAEHVAMSIADYRREGRVEHICRPEAVQLALLQI